MAGVRKYIAIWLALLAISVPAFAADSDTRMSEIWDINWEQDVRGGEDITGVWSCKELGFELEIYGCGNAILCGRVISYSRSVDFVNLPKTPQVEEVAGDQWIVGRELLTGFEADRKDGARWSNGRIFNPKDGRTYKSTITMADQDTLKLRAYVGIPIFGRNLILKRIPQYSPAGGS